MLYKITFILFIGWQINSNQIFYGETNGRIEIDFREWVFTFRKLEIIKHNTYANVVNSETVSWRIRERQKEWTEF